MFSELPQLADIVRGPSLRSGSGQLHAKLWPNNATRFSTIDWLWSAKRASVWVTGGSRGRVYRIAEPASA